MKNNFIFNDLGNLKISPISFAKTSNGLIYLAIFNGKDWVEFHYFKQDGIPKKVVFKKLK